MFAPFSFFYDFVVCYRTNLFAPLTQVVCQEGGPGGGDKVIYGCGEGEHEVCRREKR